MIKAMGSNKIGKTCPSKLETTILETNGIASVQVKYWKTDCGHAQEIGRLKIDKENRAMIAGDFSNFVFICDVQNVWKRSLDYLALINHNLVTWKHILDFIREGEITDNTNQRILPFERQDLTNISRDFNINYATRRHKNDAVSVNLWVNELKSQFKEDCPILYYKAQDEDDIFLERKDFALILMTKFQAKQILKFGPNKICIDGTHGTNAYDIQLYTIMTVDEYGTGYPVAFCFSNRVHETIFKLFFNQIKTKVGIIKSKVFMSDDAPAFYNAWVVVMWPAEHRLLCTWHVDRNWRDNLCKISGGSEKKSLVYKTLRVLLQMTSIYEFKISLDQFINDLLEDNDTAAYGSYFVQHYSKRSEV
ncbi:uncharacterized protein LOC103309671 [Acyrthosiphon pisum]|uniref:MULE transposase domain-containing protein n=1 Tax=Acyrthosiphon pisum TaxID=7029 RepID=A0A8R2B6P6_ACYPI|nr:uncharacterized protein LOC103309671 [Acyrthosiphon pisum]|eukprot:XP_008183946.1 PREDICTED: uncharacterized protein LOC103309671 [Acyrthosiphon pisum]